MSDSLRPDSDVIERAARAMADDWNPDRDPILTAMFRDYANTLAAAGLLTPSDTFASTKPSDAGVAVCAWCPSVASGSALHNDGLRHPSCGRADHGQGWVPDPASDGAVSSRGFDLHALAADWEKVTAAAGLDPDAMADEVLAALAYPDVAERIEVAWDEGFEAGVTWTPHTNGIPNGPPDNPYHHTPPAPSPEILGFEVTRSALDGLTIRKEKTSD